MTVVPVFSNEPGRLEAIMTRFAPATFALGYHKKLARKTVLTGNEMVIDFGSGSGMGARYLAKELSKGDGHLTCVDISGV
ncbi:MAG: class I SAM-dependent methyltransferase [Methanomassiliicoccales archaeon]